jgi:glycosyltransferase involved in cell wall biosynthesis
MRRVAYFFPFSPLPAHSGAARRCVEMLWGLRELGYRTDVLFVPSAGSPPAGEIAEQLRREWGVHRVHAHQPGRLDYRVGGWLSRLGLTGVASPPYNSPLVVAWFRRRLREIAPDVLFMSYAFADCLAPRRNHGMTKVIDSIDLWSLYAEYRRSAERQLPAFPIRPDAVGEAFLREDYYERLAVAPDRREFEVYDRYGATLAISAKEASILRAGTRKTRVSYLPMTQEPVHQETDPEGPALFVMRSHPFNLQGYCYLARRVLPAVRARAPSFRLRVIGDGCPCVTPVEGVTLDGFVPDLREAYRASRFAIVPVFGGTGQQVKLIEAMGHGVPVVAVRQAAEASPLIEHGVNGLIAADAAEFAEHMIRLWQDPHLCRAMGRAARESIAKHFSRERLLRGLAEVMASGT